MAKLESETIAEAMSKVNERYFLPDIQREYVWLQTTSDHKIENLFDSIMRGYPIGNLLAWRRNTTDIDKDFTLYKFIERYKEDDRHNEKILLTQIKPGDIDIILDGQQRLTSLYIALKGDITVFRKRAWRNNGQKPDIDKALYLNLKYIPTEGDPDDGYDFEFLTKDEVAEDDDTKFWFKVSDVLKPEFDVNEFLREKHIDENKTCGKVLGGLYTQICDKENLYINVESGRTIDDMLTIFIRVNSGGTQLSYSDLLMSVLTSSFKRFDVREEMNNLVDEFAKNGFATFGRDQLLKTMLVLSNVQNKFSAVNLSDRKIVSKIENNWEPNVEAIRGAVDQLRDFGFANVLSQSYIITSIAYFLKTYGKIAPNDLENALRFVQIAQIKNYFSFGPDAKLNMIRDTFAENDSFAKILDVMANAENNKSLKITADDVDAMANAQYGQGSTFAILQLLYPNLDYKNHGYDVDHIFPRSKFTGSNKDLPKEYKNRANYLFNLELLEHSDNIKKSNMEPAEWFDHAGQKYSKEAYLPKSVVLEWQNIAPFEEKRTEMLLAQLRKTLLNN